MRSHPDLTYPLLPDAQDDLPIPATQRPIRQGGMSLRDTVDHAQVNEGEYEWPEAGPSQPKESRVGPFGAKAVAAMTGAMATSLLMTPFDVLKTRLQTVQPHPRPEYSISKIIQPTSEECCQTTLLSNSNPQSRSRISPIQCQTTSSTSSALHSSSTNTQHVSFANLRPSAAGIGSIPLQEAPEGCLHPSKWSGIWGEALTLESGVSNPSLSRNSSIGSIGGAGVGVLQMPTHAQERIRLSAVQSEEQVMRGFFSELAAVRRENGVRGLWKGVGTAITMGIPSSAIYMLGYEQLLTIISPYFTGSSDPSKNTSSLNRRPDAQNISLTASLTPAPLIAGSLARTLSATVISPIEMFRTRLQALPSVERGSPTYASTAKDMSKLVQTKGVTILWRGLGPTLWRDVPFSGIYWAGFELMKSYLNTSPTTSNLSPISTSFISGFLSGTISAVVTQPFDVLKTRRQVFNPTPGCETVRASTIPLAMHVIKTEGWGALFAGLSARCGKVAPACGLMIACYEGVGRYLGGRE
ncbi:uncharacterized protein I303_100307 [Kwoniella dejecticola CBS 10117]|uniref:Solute carrier family 25, member 39/40 n=1 Tax=Kwoniella dejecticola CBS 10117 TaxID=1296121 RepID=A0A1A6AEJ7_9TREE|nr:uncharacterized protein I303_00307 [Kwoniella dejecticola CBS 10117]OBR88490.1 hypothetical protein I303_00307 [Kwoniella dejecticola CBS 10117]